MNRPSLSVVVIARNEADRIGRLLASVTFADEVIVVDSGSTDDTRALCAGHGARVVEKEWAGYAAQKQFAMEQAGSDWVLNLDADEAVPELLAREIREAILKARPSVAAFSMPRLSWYLGRWIRHGGWYPDRKVRLVRKGKGRWAGDGLHEQLMADGDVLQLTQPMHHFVYRNLFDQVATINQFSGLGARARGVTGGWYVVAGLFHAMGKFLECYVWKLGLLDGLAGLVIAVNSAFYVFLRHAKSWELGMNRDGHPTV